MATFELVRGELSPKAFEAHHNNVKSFGLLPPGFTVKEAEGKLQYIDPQTHNSSPVHPLKNIDPNSQFRSEPTQGSTKVNVVGVSHPTRYQAGDWTWAFYDEPLKAVFAALIEHEVISDDKAALRAFMDKAQPLRAPEAPCRKDFLYHPVDRVRILIYDQERILSQLCREYQRGLDIATPEVTPGGKGRPRVWSTKPEVRQPVRIRRSTGAQEVWPPIVLGCIPQFDASGPAAWWYVLKPASPYSKELCARWNKVCDWKIERFNFGLGDISEIKTVQWIVVRAHRAVLHREIDEPQIGTFIRQLLKFYQTERNKPYGKRRDFYFRTQEKYDGPEISFEKLSGCIVASGLGSWAHTFARKSDALIEALDRNEYATNMQSFMAKVMAIPLDS